MNPKKKIRNTILCPSKRFPGRMYYYNVSTGETAWAWFPSKIDKNLKKGQIHRADEPHTYSEPFHPPIGNTAFRHNAMETRPSPVFAQSWTPMHTVRNQPICVPTSFQPLNTPPCKVHTSELGKNDLRWKLIKRRKVCATEPEKTTAAGVIFADQSTSRTREIQEAASHSSDAVQDNYQTPESSRMRELSQPTPDGLWYVVTDTTALLEDWQYIEEFVKRDPRCRLLVPHAVYTELEWQSRGDYSLLALQMIWKLKMHSHIIVQNKPVYELSTEDSILQYCWTLLQKNIHVVLLSNNTNMLNKAKLVDLECYTLDGIHHDDQTTAEPQNDLETPKIIQENLFMKGLSEVNGESRKNVLETGTYNGSQLSKRNANSNKLIDVTRSRDPRVNRLLHSENII